MNTRYLLSAISFALIAAGESFRVSAENAPEDIQGVLVGGADEVLEPGEIAAGDATLDATGLPWHPQLHAGTKKFKTDGTWTRKKGVSDVEFNAITAELRKTHPVTTVTTGTTPAGLTLGTLPGLKLPGLTLAPIVKSKYTELCEWLAENADKGGPLTSTWVQEQLGANKITVEMLSASDELSASWHAAFKGAIGQA